MSTDQQDNEPRLTNGEILRELRTESRETGKTLAVMTTQVAAIVGMLASMEQKHDDLMKRSHGHDSEFVNVRSRLEALEGRPAMTPEERAALKAQVVDHERRLAQNETNIHDMGLREFSPSERDEVRRYLEIARRRGVDDAFGPEEVDAVRALLKRDEILSASHRSIGIMHRSNWPLYLVGSLAGVSGIVQIADLIAHAAGR